MRPHNLPFVMLGHRPAVVRLVRLQRRLDARARPRTPVWCSSTRRSPTAAALLGWLLVEKLRDGHMTTLGAASGAVAGLVAITPACGFVNIWGALAVGAAAGIICSLAVTFKHRLGYDDALDVVGVHLVGGLVGTLMIGIVGDKTHTLTDSLFDGGSFGAARHAGDRRLRGPGLLVRRERSSSPCCSR